MKELRILGLYVSDRQELAQKVQVILSKYGCNVKTRLGLHEVANDVCRPNGLILLELTGSNEDMMKLENELLMLDGVQVKKMVFIP